MISTHCAVAMNRRTSNNQTFKCWIISIFRRKIWTFWPKITFLIFDYLRLYASVQLRSGYIPKKNSYISSILISYSFETNMALQNLRILIMPPPIFPPPSEIIENNNILNFGVLYWFRPNMKLIYSYYRSFFLISNHCAVDMRCETSNNRILKCWIFSIFWRNISILTSVHDSLMSSLFEIWTERHNFVRKLEEISTLN